MSIGSHTIPVFYLQPFARDPSSRRKKYPLVWVYEKGREPVERSLRVQGKEKGYFAAVQEDGTFDDEAMEARITALENDCNDVLFCSRSELFDWSSSANRNKLAFYMALLYSRATQRRDHSGKIQARTADELQKLADDTEFMEQLANSINAAAQMQVFTPDSMRARVLDLASNEREPKKIKTHFATSVHNMAEHLSGYLLVKRWQVWKAPSGAEFVTSDNPVINFIPLANGPFHPGHGFNRPGVFTAFPLSPERCLVVGVAPGSPESLTVPKGVVDKTNEALISICDRYVYSKSRTDDIRRMVEQYAGTFRYGQNALMPVGLKLPTMRGLLRHRFGLDAEN